MGKVRVNVNGPVSKEVVDLNQDENKEISIRVVGVLGEGQGILKDDELRVTENVLVENENDARTEADQVQVLIQSEQQLSEQQLPDPTFLCWEGFLPTKSLKVLVVEGDDSTRRVISALLRKCGYKVTAVASGQQAWDILKDHRVQVDLVLTEVVMPVLSGIGLLTKMMSHKTSKDIPVIMMSSHDSLGLVFECLSIGAADFLVKPIRKNELKNLWQHAWRKCRSSSGSASETGAPNQKSTSTSAEKSGKNTGSNHEDDIETIGLNARDESDKGSGTEIIHSSPEGFGNDLVPAITTRECEGKDEDLDADLMGTDLNREDPKIPKLQLEERKEKELTNIAVTNEGKLSEMNSMRNDEIQQGQPELRNVKLNGALENQVVDLMATDPQMQSVIFDIPNSVTKTPNAKDKNTDDYKDPSFELSLRTERNAQHTGLCVQDQNSLIHASLAALSKYKFPTNSPLDNGSEEEKAIQMPIFQSNSTSTALYQCSNGCSNNHGTTCNINNFVAKQKEFEGKQGARSTIKDLRSSPQPIKKGKTDAAFGKAILEQKGINHQVQMEHRHIHYPHHHLLSVPQHQHIPDRNDFCSKNMVAEAPQCGPYNVLGASIEGTFGHHSLHRSDSLSKHSNNEHNMGGSATNSRGADMENGIVGKEGSISPTEAGGESRDDKNHLPNREIALNKFRQKRKERCFEKKVRYQSRKKLADQRPRVRGKFVQQEAHENKGEDTDC